jgi:N-ethylmaleimide reductase
MPPKQAVSKLFSPLQIGRIGSLEHRVVLAPLTRNRATEPELVPSALTVQYYRQRASPGGLLISEATNISPESLAYPSTPGIWSTRQVEGWQDVTRAVHDQGGYMVCQLWHTGRVAHPDYAKHPANDGDYKYAPCVSASPTPIVNRHGKRGKTITHEGNIEDHGMPRELSKDDIARVCRDYARAAQNAKEAGFDGVELHAAHGYLMDQFLNNGVNKRTDDYGGSVQNRCRFLQQVLDAILEVFPSQQVGVRLSPHDSPNGGNTYYGCKDANPDQVYLHAVQLLNRQDLAYLFLTEPRWVGKHDATPETDPGFQMPLMNLQKYRHVYDGVLMGAGGFTPSSSFAAMTDSDSSAENGYDALAFGRWFIANPDLPVRLQAWHDYEQQEGQGRTTGRPRTKEPPPLNRYERDTFYTQQAEGYIDYPSLEFEKYCNEGIGQKKQDYQGMELGKYALVEQQHVGMSLKATDGLRSKL